MPSFLRASHWIDDWDPEDPAYWRTYGRAVALRNLAWSIATLVCAFMAWMVWSGLVVYLPRVRSDLSLSQLYWLTALPLMTAGFLRIVYAFCVPIWGGRNWTAWSTGVLLLPLALAYVGLQWNAPFWLLVLAAILAGLGGANFASSSANVSLLFPHRRKGIAVGINAALGNLGVGLIQALVPVLAGSQLGQQLGICPARADQAVCLPAVPIVLGLIVLAVTVAAARGMNSVPVARQSPVQEMRAMARDRHFWIMALLYTLTFGSFVGFAASLPILTASLFGRADYGWLAFAGAFLAALMRPVGHVIAGRFGSVRLTVCVFALLACGFGALPLFAPVDGTGGHYAAFIATATLIFAATGLGNGSTISMLPDIYLVPMLRRGGIDAAERKALRARAARSTAIALGLVSAVATFGAFLMPKIFDWSLAWLADASYAMYCFAFLNLLCLAVTWRVYGRKAAGNPLCIGNAGHRGFVIVDRADRYGELT